MAVKRKDAKRSSSKVASTTISRTEDTNGKIKQVCYPTYPNPVRPIVSADPPSDSFPLSAPTIASLSHTQKQSTVKTTPVDVTKQPFYYPKQYGGITLGLISVIGTALYDPHDENKVVKLVGFLFLMIIAVVIHEMRPFRRKGYSDVAREQGISIWHMLGLRR